MSFIPDQGNPEQPSDQMTFKVGEREYNAESAITKISNQDEHIARLEAENAQFKQEQARMALQLEQSTKLEDALSKLNQQQSYSQNTPHPDPTPTGLSAGDIEAIATQQAEQFYATQQATQQKAEAERLAKQSYEATGAELRKIYGEDVDGAISKKAQEMGVEPSQLYDMAYNPATAKLLLESMKPARATQTSYPSGGRNMSHGYGEGTEPRIDISNVDKVTSSTIMEALHKHGAAY